MRITETGPAGQQPVGTRTALDKPLLVAACVAVAAAVLTAGAGFVLIAAWWPQGWIARAGWLLTLLAPLLATLASVRQHRQRARRLALTAAGLIGALLGLLPLTLVGDATPTFAAVRHAVDGVRLPAGVQEISRVQGGDRRCHDGCPHLTLRYSIPGYPNGGDQTAAAHALRVAFGARGWRQDQNDESSLFLGRLHAQVLPAAAGQLEATVGHDDVTAGTLIRVR